MFGRSIGSSMLFKTEHEQPKTNTIQAHVMVTGGELLL